MAVRSRGRAVASRFVGPGRRFVDRLLVLRGDGRRLTVTYGASGGDEARHTVVNELWTNPAEIERYTVRLRCLQFDQGGIDLEDLGLRIGWLALPSIIRARFLDELADATRRGCKLRLWIHDDECGLGEVPWEYMFVEEADPGFLALNPACSIVRHSGVVGEATADDDPRILRRDEPLRVLLAYADPTIPSFPKNFGDALIDHLRGHLGRLSWPPDVRVLLPAGRVNDRRQVASCNQVARELESYRPHVVFLLAHGEFDSGRREGIVYLESDPPGTFDAVSARELEAIVPHRDGPTIIFLDCCSSADRGSSAAGTSVARAVSAPGRAVVSMQFPWPAASDPPFWNTLFSSLTVPSPLDDCVSEAREMVGRNSPNAPDWGVPVLHRPGVPLSRGAPVVLEPRWSEDFAAIRPRLRGRDRALIDELLVRLPQWQDRIDISSGIKQLDPLWVWLAGDQDPEETPVVASPIWFTRLLKPPHAFEWRTDRRGPWWFSAWVAGGDDLAYREVAHHPIVEFSANETAAWPPGRWIRWQVRSDAERTRRPPALVRGMFQLLDGEAVRSRRARLKDELRQGADRRLGAAAALLRDGLHDALIRRCSTLLRRRLSAPARFLIHRLLASSYGEMQRQLALASIGAPEGLWAAARARQQVEASYRAAAGSGLPLEEVT